MSRSSEWAELAPVRQEMEATAALLGIPQKRLLDRVRDIGKALDSGQVDAAQRRGLERERRLTINVALGQKGVPQASVELFHALKEPQFSRLLNGDQLRLSTATHTLPDHLAELVSKATRPLGEREPQEQSETVAWLGEGNGEHEFGPAPRKDRALACSSPTTACAACRRTRRSSAPGGARAPSTIRLP